MEKGEKWSMSICGVSDGRIVLNGLETNGNGLLLQSG